MRCLSRFVPQLSFPCESTNICCERMARDGHGTSHTLSSLSIRALTRKTLQPVDAACIGLAWSEGFSVSETDFLANREVCVGCLDLTDDQVDDPLAMRGANIIPIQSAKPLDHLFHMVVEAIEDA